MLQTHQSPLARKFTACGTLSADDFKVLSNIHRRRRRFPSGSELVQQGLPNHSAYILAVGWAFSYILLPDGRRQIVDFRIPGDIMGLGSLLFRKSDQNVELITLAEASEVLATDLLSTFVATPGLIRALLWDASRDESVVAERLVGLGRRNAAQRVAHFLLELGARLRLVGLGNRSGYPCPLTQYHLADALGLSPVHVNRVLRHLREQGLVTFQKRRVAFHNFDRLVVYARFDEAYLDTEGA